MERFRLREAEACGDMKSFERRTTKAKGDLFEDFCVIYLKSLGCYTNVWKLKDIPVEIKKQLSLPKGDRGIDIVAEAVIAGAGSNSPATQPGNSNAGRKIYIAIQAKYRTADPKGKEHGLTWKGLSTFYALCARTGPWAVNLVISNCKYCKKVGQKLAKDMFKGKDDLEKITREEWIKMANLPELEGHTLDVSGKKLTAGEVREQRLLKLGAKEKKSDQTS